MENRPKAKITFVGYEINIDNCVRNAKTEEQAHKLAQEWEAEEVKKWEAENSREQKDREAHDYFWTQMTYFVKDLKVEAQQSGKRRNPDEVAFLKRIRERIEALMKKSEAR